MRRPKITFTTFELYARYLGLRARSALKLNKASLARDDKVFSHAYKVWMLKALIHLYILSLLQYARGSLVIATSQPDDAHGKAHATLNPMTLARQPAE